MNKQDEMRKLINYHSRRLQKLKEQQALQGISTDPSILLEIEDIERELENLQDHLADLDNVAKVNREIAYEREKVPPITFESVWRNKDLNIIGYSVEGAVARSSSIVFVAKDENKNRSVAIKVIDISYFSPDERTIFFENARALAKLNHPGIVKLYDIQERANIAFIIMEYVEGEEISNLIYAQSTKGSLPQDNAVEMIIQIANALNYAHMHGVIHKEISPQKIIVDNQKQTHLIGFRLIPPLDDPLMGTPAYVAPETITDEVENRLTDIYCLGLVFYEMLTGFLPFEQGDNTPYGVLVTRLTEEPKPLRQIDANIDSELERICLRCIAREPEKRYKTAGALSQELRNWRPQKRRFLFF